jgi:hypothetical protein
MTLFIKDIKKENQQERGEVMNFWPQPRGGLQYFMLVPAGGSQFFNLFFQVSTPLPP